MLTKDQQTQLVQAAKQKNPKITLQETKELLDRANSLNTGNSPISSSSSQDLASQLKDVVESNQGKTFSSSNQSQGVVEKLARLFANTTINNVNTVKNFAGESGNIDKTNQSMDELFKQSQALTAQAKTETDPTKKAALLQQARDLMNQNANQASNLQSDLTQKQQASGITDKDIERGSSQFAIRRGLGQSAELGALLLPGASELQAAKGASVGAKAIAGAVQGLTAGEMQGLANASQNSDTIKDALTEIVKNAGIGAVTGGVLGGVTAKIGGSKVINKLSNEMDDVDRLVSTAENTTDKSKYAASAFRKIYQEAFPISKAGKSFERLKPEQTIDDAIKYNWTGTGNQIKNKISQWTGNDGLATNIVKSAVKDVKNSNAVEIPEVEINKLAAKFSNVSEKEVKQQVLRLADLKPGDLPGQTNIDDMITLERNLSKEGYQNLVTGKTTQNAKALESGQLKLELADKLGDTIDSFAQKNGGNITKYTNDSRVLALAKKIGGDNLVNDLKNTKTISDLRSLQKSGVRMSQIIDLNSQLPSTIGNKFLGILNKVPIVGTVANQAVNAVEQPISTNIATKGNALYKTLQSAVNKSPVTKSSAVNNAVINQLSQLIGRK
jgi:hypothetical protein